MQTQEERPENKESEDRAIGSYLIGSHREKLIYPQYSIIVKESKRKGGIIKNGNG